MLTNNYILNQGQQNAADAFFKFLFDDTNEFIISGPGGTGKTALMSYLIDKTIPEYTRMCTLMGIPSVYRSVVMCATTNKAAQVLAQETQRATETIHSFLHLKVADDYQTGESKLKKTRDWRVYTNTIIFIDEASMIDHQLLGYIRESTLRCKIVYVGDHCQLPPVKAFISPIYKLNLQFYELTEPMRNNNQPALMNLCSQLRNTVETGIFKPITAVSGVIDWLSGSETEQEVINHFQTLNSTARILSYTNQSVISYNDYIRSLRQLTDAYTVGEQFINNTGIPFSTGFLAVEEEITILDVATSSEIFEIEPGVEMYVRNCSFQTSSNQIFHNILLPENKDHFISLLKYYAKEKDWEIYYTLKNKFPDFRPKDAVTVHKIQGSTLDTVFINMTDLSTCRVPATVARLLYVAISRAKNRVIMYGNLSEKYGGIVR